MNINLNLDPKVLENVKFEEIEGEQFVTAYQIAKMLKNLGVERKAQQMYRYIDQKLIKSQKVNEQRLVKLSDAIAFATKFAEKHGSAS